MRNRAKCKLCQDIIESFHRHDYVSCSCGEISVDGGLDYLKARASDFKNFVRVDDQGNEIPVKVVEKEVLIESLEKDAAPPLTGADYYMMLQEIIKNYENLPTNSMTAPVTHYDLHAVLVLLSHLLSGDCKPLS